ncbi:hypothetical protein KJ786_01805 [Patescibacteria group bacterium]|nr:hypothetical protein [Patescibacteria group bacterium]
MKKKSKNRTMTTKEITKFLEWQLKGKRFQVLCYSGTHIVDAVICTKIIKKGQLIEIRLEWGNILQKHINGWYLKLQENGIEGGKVRKCIK